MEGRCRLCGRKEGAEKLKNIFDGEPGMGLDGKINKLLPIVVVQWDPLPHGICDPCVEKLNALDKFYEDTGNTNKFLKKLLPFQQTREPEKGDPMLKLPNLYRTYGSYLKFMEKVPSDENSNDPLDRNHCSTDLEGTIEPAVSEKPCEPIVIDLENDENANVPPKRTIDWFFVTVISEKPRVVVYTCRQCYHTYTTRLTARAHVCENETLTDERKENDHPELKMKIRLHTSRGYIHTCDICKMTFTRKSALRTHLLQHIWSVDETISMEEEDEEYFRNKKRKKMKKDKSHSECNEAIGRIGEEPDEVLQNSASIAGKEVSSSTTESNNDCIRKDIEKNVCNQGFLSQKVFTHQRNEHQDLTQDKASLTSHQPPTIADHEVIIGEKIPPKKETCELCDKAFSDKDSLQEHQKWHLRMSEDILTSDRFKLHKHKRSVKKDNEKKKVFNSSMDASFSENNSVNEDLYICKLCNMAFSRRSSLDSHEMSHISSESMYDFFDS